MWLSGKSTRVLWLAEMEARWQNSRALKPEHLLTSLFRHEAKSVTEVLKPLIRSGGDAKRDRLLKLASREAGKQGPVEPEHVLLALFAEDKTRTLMLPALRKIVARRLEDDLSEELSTWHGIIRPESLSPGLVREQLEFTRHVKARNWDKVFTALKSFAVPLNRALLGVEPQNAVLHEVAQAGAPATIVRRLLDQGAWRSLPNAAGDRPVDIAKREGHRHLVSMLTPILKRQVSAKALKAIQEHFHALIRKVAEPVLRKHPLRLPELAPMLETSDGTRWWFPVPGMYGGFGYYLELLHGSPALVTESECRIVGGSYMQCLITPYGFIQLAGGWDHGGP